LNVFDEFYKAQGNSMAMANSTVELRQSLAVLSPYWWRCLFFSWVVSLLVLASTVYMFEVYDRVVNSRNTTTLLMLTLWVVMVYALMEALDWSRSETFRVIGERWDKQLIPRLLDVARRVRLQREDLPPGQVLNDFRILRDGLMNPVVSAAMEAPISLVFLLVLFTFHPWLGWASLVGALVQVGITFWNEKRNSVVLREAGHAAAAAQASVEEALRHADVIAAMGLEQALRQRWGQWQSRLVKLQAAASDSAGIFQALSKFVQTLLGSLLLGLSAYLLLRNELPGGGGLMILASVLGGRVLTPLVQAVTQWRAVVQMHEAWVRLSAALAGHPALPPSMPLPAPRGHLSVENVWVQAPDGGATLLRGVALSLSPGQCLGVIGPSGAGKTSLARVLVGMWPASQGKVRLDGADLYAWEKTELGPYMGYLPQSVDLLEGSLSQNIARFTEPNGTAMQDVLALTELNELVNALPQGLDTQVGRDGVRLSAGQRQRIGLARALYGEPVLLVLDEPNAHLDEEGERVLLRVLAALKTRGATVVLMTHRSAMLAVTDQLLILRDGATQAYGPRDEVVRALQKAAMAAQPGARA
jgi:ATP-binding cassette subfamily C exporter for protease/lipase